MRPYSLSAKIDCPVKGCNRKMLTGNMRKHVVDIHKFGESEMIKFHNFLKIKKAFSNGNRSYRCSECETAVGPKPFVIHHIQSTHSSELGAEAVIIPPTIDLKSWFSGEDEDKEEKTNQRYEICSPKFQTTASLVLEQPGTSQSEVIQNKSIGNISTSSFQHSINKVPASTVQSTFPLLSHYPCNSLSEIKVQSRGIGNRNPSQFHHSQFKVFPSTFQPLKSPMIWEPTCNCRSEMRGISDRTMSLDEKTFALQQDLKALLRATEVRRYPNVKTYI